jgi:uncharacterized membrane protein
MTTTMAPQPEISAYLDEVRGALDDLPEAERDDLLAEVEASLVDAAAEGGSLAARLGPARDFAAELRSAAGLHETVERPRPGSALVRARQLAHRAAASPVVAQLRSLTRELAPIGWVLRAYFAVAVVTFAIDATWSSRLPFVPNGFGTAVTGVAFILLALFLSVVLGLLTRGTTLAPIVGLASALLVVAALPALGEALDASGRSSIVVTQTAAAQGLVYEGVRVDNIYPYSRDGKLLHDVLLYDGAGRPLEIPANRIDDPDRRFVVTNGNEPLFNVFPIRYYEPGTKRVERPNAAPYIKHPLVVTPPLPAERR